MRLLLRVRLLLALGIGAFAAGSGCTPAGNVGVSVGALTGGDTCEDDAPEAHALPYGPTRFTTVGATDAFRVPPDTVTPTCTAPIDCTGRGVTGSLPRGAVYTGTGTGPDRVHAIRVSEACSLSITMDPVGNQDLSLFLFDETCTNTLAGCGCVSDVDSEGAAESIQLNAVAGKTYYIVVDGYSTGAIAPGPSGEYDLSITETTQTGCTLVEGDVCGNGVVTGAELCDDGNTTSGDGCDANCTVTACGNGIVTNGEACDDGNLTNGDDCDSDCSFTACGNGIVTSGEVCDDGNDIADDGCENDCTVTTCGDGTVGEDESCDDGNRNDDDGCDSNCTVTACGNGVVTSGEDCDDGNETDGDDCDSNCTVTACGNGVVTSGEGCDDGNQVAGDGCENDCTVTPDPEPEPVLDGGVDGGTDEEADAGTDGGMDAGTDGGVDGGTDAGVDGGTDKPGAGSGGGCDCSVANSAEGNSAAAGNGLLVALALAFTAARRRFRRD